MTIVEAIVGQLGKTRVTIFCGDITQQEADAIVNPTNGMLHSQDPADLALKRAGGLNLLKECRYHVARCGRCPLGEAVVTGAGRLKARHVIHAVAPAWAGGQRQEERLLRQTYWNVLLRAEELGLSSLVLPSLGTSRGVPVSVEARVALSAVRDFLLRETGLEEIRFVLLSKYDVLEYEPVWETISCRAVPGDRLAGSEYLYA